ncbi:MAG: hypothetical protein KDA88_23060 [Planctomycetaceae bacterium]|nr:hypothetical protein [Planctomycetaceae bacterium]MCB9953452.1 hypothetical protein [Planctomycetaceae bacterium]
MFYRVFPDRSRVQVNLENHFAGPTPTACWIVGGGPSLTRLPIAKIVATGIPKFSINLAGTGLLQPDFWTSYDPTARFHKSVYLSPAIMKFVHTCRALDLVPESTFKVCESPNLFCFDRTRGRGFFDFPADSVTNISRPVEVSPNDLNEGITDWQDSLIQAIDISFRLGFRKLYLIGCEMFLAPPAALLKEAERRNVTYNKREPLPHFMARCREAGMTKQQIEVSDITNQYHFDETKPFDSAIRTDDHYYRVAQYLRLSRRAMALAGLQLISSTPDSRLNDYFPFQPVEEVIADIDQEIGNLRSETTTGRYTSSESRQPAGLMPMRDFSPHNWNTPAAKPSPPVEEVIINEVG